MTAQEDVSVPDSAHELNPWFSMWLKPRQTIQQIIDDDPFRSFHVLAICYGISEYLDRAMESNHGVTQGVPTILIFALLVGSIWGIVVVYIAGFMIRWTGAWMGGTDAPENIRAALVWSMVPGIWIMPLWIPLVAIYGQGLFTHEKLQLQHVDLITLFIAIKMVVGVWVLVLLCKSIGQVQGFSAWKSLGNLVLAGLPFFLIIIALSMRSALGAN